MIVDFICTFIAIFMAWMITTAIEKRIRKREFEKARKELEDEIRKKQSAPGYTGSVMEFIRDLTAQVAVLKFREFADSRSLEKVTKEHTKHLIQDIANSVKGYIDQNKLDEEGLLVSPQFMNEYIINMSVNCVKDLLKKAVDDEFDGI